MRRIKLGIAAATASVMGVAGLGIAMASPAAATVQIGTPPAALVHICLTIMAPKPSPDLCIDI